MELLTLASFECADKPNGTVGRMAWDNLVPKLTTHREREQKDGPGWNAAAYLNGNAYRKNGNVEALSCLVLDLDDGTPLEALRGLLDPYEWAAYTTFSHTPEHPKYRVVLPLSRPVPAEEWEEFWFAAVIYLAAGRVDAKCKDPSRFYYLPACRPGAERWAVRNNGEWLNPDTMPRFALPSARTRYVGDRPTTDGERVPPQVLVDAALEAVARGEGRSNSGLGLACQLRDNHYTAEEAGEIILGYVGQVPVGSHPYTEEEALASVRQAFSRAAREPWAARQKPGSGRKQASAKLRDFYKLKNPETLRPSTNA